MSQRPLIIALWASASLIFIAVAVIIMMVGGNRSMLLIGATTDAHHQIEMACESCHSAGAFASAKEAKKELNKSCAGCHAKQLQAADDSHSRKRFRNPRMAEYWEKIDARFCTSCHVEHRPEITRSNSVTVAMDFCIACHSEGDQDIRRSRPSHVQLSFDTCSSSGCHNFHDNRSLYADFLIKHADQPWLNDKPVHELAEIHRVAMAPHDDALSIDDAMAPASELSDTTVLDEWTRSGHASAGVNCTACHMPDGSEDSEFSKAQSQWITSPTLEVCADCHKFQTSTFALGRHGMRQHPKVSAPRNAADSRVGALLTQTIANWLSDSPLPRHMTVAEARIEMRADAFNKALDCGTCHQVHAVNTVTAAVDSCLMCHDDSHSKSYANSPHHSLWQAEISGTASAGTGVSCATCHMPKTKRRGRVLTSHDQNEILRPNEKMIRTVCLDCHGLQFTLNSLADDDLISKNFDRPPTVHVESIEWALRHAQSASNDN